MINKRYDVASKSRGALITTSYKPEKSSNHLHVCVTIRFINQDSFLKKFFRNKKASWLKKIISVPNGD